ncbi:MAG TPA: VWA domain-containing protein [Blastocatellia bacterium]|nr:VWA domain-containing protein [Blastocatellia bacterium]
MKTFARSFIVIIIASFLTATVVAKPDPYKMMINHLKKRYNAKQMRLPLVIGLVSFGARIYTKGAVKGLKVAIFKEQNFSEPIQDPGFETVFKSFDASWTPMIRFYSRKQMQRTYLYAKEAGKDFQIMITAIQPDNAVVLTVKVNPVQLAKFIEKHNNGQSILGDFGLDDLTGSKNRTVIAESDKNNPGVGLSKDDPIFANSTKAAETATKAGDASVVADAPAVEKTVEQSLEPADAPPPAPTAPTATAPVIGDSTIRGDIVIDTKLINLNAKVANAAGKPILTLTKDDFTLYENNVKQEITHFSPVTAPINLVLLLDFSGSTEKKKDVMKDAAKRFVDSLGPEDRVAVAAFARRFYLKTSFISDKKQLKKVIGDLKVPSSGTRYYDAMWSALDLFKRAEGARNAIVVLTDGVDNTIMDPDEYDTKHDFDELIARIAEEDVTIYPMYLDTEYEMVVKRGGEEDAKHYAVARKQLAQVSERSGGLLFHVARIEDLNGVYDRVAAELKTIYSLAYSSSLDDGAKPAKKEWRSIKLSVNQPGAAARTKNGYYAK